VLQWQGDGNNRSNPRQKSPVIGAFLFLLGMQKHLKLLIFFLVGCSDFGTNPKEEVVLDDVSFAEDIQPMLNASCINCHGNNGGLSVRTYDNLMKGTSNNGPVVIPNNGIGSFIVKKLKGNASGDRMPPEPANPWDDSKIEIIIKWIDQGAKNN